MKAHPEPQRNEWASQSEYIAYWYELEYLIKQQL